MRKSTWFALIALATLVIAVIVWWPRVERGLLALHGIEVAPASAKTTKSSSAKTGKSSSAKDDWPESHAGIVARHWVAAYDSGDVAMRRFYDSRMSPESLKKKNAEA